MPDPKLTAVQTTLMLPIPEGSEFERVGIPKKGEMVLIGDGTTYVSDFNHDHSYGVRVIVRKTWAWPACLHPSIVAIAHDAELCWYSFDSEPQGGSNGWRVIGVQWKILTGVLDDSLLPPFCDDWRQSLRLKPGVEAT